MALGKRKGSDFTPIIKYDARHGLVYLVDRVRAPTGVWEAQQRDITKDFRAIFDLEKLERGWIYYPSGAPPELTMVPAGQDPGEQPSPDHKEGIRFYLKLPAELGGDVRELQSTALAMWDAIDALHTAYLNQVTDHPDELPIVKLVEVIKVPTGKGQSFTPVFEIIGWAKRPFDLPKSRKKTNGTRKPAKQARAADDDFGANDLGSDSRVSSDLDDTIPF